MGQFLIDGYSPPFRLDVDNNELGVKLLVRTDIQCKLQSVENNPQKVVQKWIHKQPNGCFVALTPQIDTTLIFI